MLEIKRKGSNEVLCTVHADTLVGADLREMRLAEADFRGADLRGAHMEFSDLRGADLSGANRGHAVL